MLQATANATYGDDVHREDKTTEALQRDMAATTGHEAGLFVLSGTIRCDLHSKGNIRCNNILACPGSARWGAILVRIPISR